MFRVFLRTDASKGNPKRSHVFMGRLIYMEPHCYPVGVKSKRNCQKKEAQVTLMRLRLWEDVEAAKRKKKEPGKRREEFMKVITDYMKRKTEILS